MTVSKWHIKQYFKYFFQMWLWHLFFFHFSIDSCRNQMLIIIFSRELSLQSMCLCGNTSIILFHSSLKLFTIFGTYGWHRVLYRQSQKRSHFAGFIGTHFIKWHILLYFHIIIMWTVYVLLEDINTTHKWFPGFCSCACFVTFYFFK